MEDTTKYFAPGHRTCAGCGGAIAVRQMLHVLKENTIICHATGCLEVTTTPYPETSWKVPWIHVTFENAVSVASGVEAAQKATGNSNATVVAFAGDGGMLDIGFRALSGAMERGHNILAVTYDNGAYMNTGFQRSGSTPYGASSTTAPAGKESIGKVQWKKNVPFIMASHGAVYVATASVGYPQDLIKKFEKAKSIEGPKFIQIDSPCTTGWGIAEDSSITFTKLAVETGFWPLYEIEQGKFKRTVIPKELKPVTEYLAKQKRFKHLNPEKNPLAADAIKHIQDKVTKRWAELEKLEKAEINFIDLL
jgi:pyruvate ferredoxin oxidoreductase beta subunit